MKSLHAIAFILLIVGGLTLGLSSIGLNVVDAFIGEDSTLAKVIYLLIGISAVYELISHKNICKKCFQ